MALYEFLACLLILVLDTTAGILGIAAGNQTDECSGEQDDIDLCGLVAFLLGFAASVLLLLAQICGNCFAGCICICTEDDLNKASAKKRLAAASHIFSLCRMNKIILAVGLTMLIEGMANAASKCCEPKPFLTVGGILCLAHGLFTVAYYLSATAAARDDRASGPRYPLETYFTGG
ncbi:uncharacterized protein LOC120190408 [Hibiscus syriacus]|uniref:uncharacterized protein LOC120190408 n=1 Tax=Hibiscus syriacus TaxID=106335 RepID=UPI001920E859|nr:uncharacterized protein LOC120190408 [Hibiscus syriacus]